MKKRLIIATTAVLVMIAVIFIAYQFSLRDDDDNMSSNNPGFLGSYQNNGYYRINPETILGDLDQGKTDVFTPFFGDPDNIKDFYTTVWTQSDYLEIANALSQKVWNEPLDLKDWGVYEVYFQEGCTDNPRGFDTLIISYYKTVKVGLEIEYSTRNSYKCKRGKALSVGEEMKLLRTHYCSDGTGLI